MINTNDNFPPVQLARMIVHELGFVDMSHLLLLHGNKVRDSLPNAKHVFADPSSDLICVLGWSALDLASDVEPIIIARRLAESFLETQRNAPTGTSIIVDLIDSYPPTVLITTTSIAAGYTQRELLAEVIVSPRQQGSIKFAAALSEGDDSKWNTVIDKFDRFRKCMAVN